MPKPLHSSRGGPQPVAWQAGPARPSQPSDTGMDAATRRALEAEIERLRQELAYLRSNQPHKPLLWCGKPFPMTWVAIALCSASLLFAIVAIIYH
jgi:hypothetical protein